MPLGQEVKASVWWTLTWLCVVLLVMLPLPVAAAEWRLFGVDNLSGYLALKSDGSQERSGDTLTTQQTLDQIARLSLVSYVFHPRFLSLTADTTFALRSSTTADSGLRNLDSGVAVDLLRENMLTVGASARSRVEDLEKDFKDYQRQTVGTAAQVSLRGARLSTTVRYENSEVKSEGYFPENTLNRLVFLDTSLRPASSDSLVLRYRNVASDDRLGAQDSRYQTADLAGTHTLKGQGRINLGLTSWQTDLPTQERYLTVRERWDVNWPSLTRASQELEATRRELSGLVSTNYRTALEATRSFGEAWQVGGSLAASRNTASNGDESAIYRLANTLGYRTDWRGYRLTLGNLLSLSQTLTGPVKTIPVYAERHRLRLDGSAAEELLYPYIKLDTVAIKDPDTPGTVWTDSCEITQVGPYTYVRWKPDTSPPAGYEGQALLDVAVDYTYELPATNYAELSDFLNLRASRELAEGVGLESNLQLTATVPGTAGTGLGGLNLSDSRYETGVQGFLKRPEYEAAAGATVGKGRKTVFAQGSTARYGWQFSESYQAEFFPDFIGHCFQTKASHLWGINEKTHVNLEFSDQTYFANGRLNQGVTGAKARTTLLLNPFMRVELEGRGELNRALSDDTKLAVDARYIWQQGQLDLTAGYEFKLRTYDRFTSQRLYVTLIRRL